MLGPQAWEYLEKLCAALPGLGVLVCTGQSTVAQRVRGLRLGADDWLTKPCHPEELIARVEAVVRRRRRAEARSSGGPITAGEIEIRSDRFQAFVRQESIDLTRREFELIELLAGAEGRVLEREEIYQRVWGYAMARGDRSVDVFVRKLRQKLEKASPGWRYIHTHFGVGYRFAPEPGGRRGHRARAGRRRGWAPRSAPHVGRRGEHARCPMSTRTARNVAIVLVLAAAVAFLPGGGTTAALVGAILSTLIIVSLVFFAYRFYREHRVELDGARRPLARPALRGDRRRRAGARGAAAAVGHLRRHARRGRRCSAARRTRSTPSGATTASTPEPRRFLRRFVTVVR